MPAAPQYPRSAGCLSLSRTQRLPCGPPDQLYPSPKSTPCPPHPAVPPEITSGSLITASCQNPTPTQTIVLDLYLLLQISLCPHNPPSQNSLVLYPNMACPQRIPQRDPHTLSPPITPGYLAPSPSPPPTLTQINLNLPQMTIASHPLPTPVSLEPCASSNLGHSK